METSVALNAPEDLPTWQIPNVPAVPAPPVVVEREQERLPPPVTTQEDGLGGFLRRLFGG
jgi:hypothetical protein